MYRSILCVRISALVLLFAMGCVLPMIAQTPQTIWSDKNVKATDVGANAKGDVWIIGIDPAPGGYAIYRHKGTAWEQVPGAALRVAVDPDGNAWVVNSSHNIFRWNGTNFTVMLGQAIDIGVGAEGSVWIIGPDNSISRAMISNGAVTGWQRVDGGAVRVAVAPDGTPWVVNAGGQIWQRQGTMWKLLSGQAKDISIAADGTPYIIGTTPAAGGFTVAHLQGGAWVPDEAAGVSIAAAEKGVVYVAKDTSSANALIARVPPAEAVSAEVTPISEFCWRDTRGRGAGEPLDTSKCAGSLEKDPNGLLCYPACKPGYKGVGPVCWQTCPAGFADTGAHCGKPESYGRGAGYPWQFGDTAFSSNGQFDRCNRDHPEGCEQDGALVYPKCKPNFHKVGCCVCSPDCPSTMADIGVSCQKLSYGRGAGDVLGCRTGLERDALLCYSSCGANSDGVGPVCWDKCPKNWVQCGMGCARSNTACAEATADQVVSVLSAAATIAAEVLTAGAAAGAKTALSAEEKVAKAAKAVEKLKFTKAFENGAFKPGQINKEIVQATLKNAVIPKARITTGVQATEKIADAAVFFTNVADVANNPNLTEEQKNFAIAQSIISTTALVDPTGIMGVVSAYTKPTCRLIGRADATPPEKPIFDVENADRETMLSLGRY